MPDDRPCPAYPDRPDHEDFRRLASIVSAQDVFAHALGGFEPMLAPVADVDSVIYVAQQRAVRVRRDLGSDPTTAIVVTWIDGFMAGQAFARHNS